MSAARLILIVCAFCWVEAHDVKWWITAAHPFFDNPKGNEVVSTIQETQTQRSDKKKLLGTMCFTDVS